ncbi:MAG TPA: hypothetical protein VK438_01885 [Xanthobacteraceae bacterium]|nr:hypothetical protein [Xanthobacteraceae bacterium]
MTTRTIAELEADIAALRAAAERAGTALACLFSSADEFEAEIVRVRRAQGAYRPRRHRWHVILSACVIGLLVLAFVLF